MAQRINATGGSVFYTRENKVTAMNIMERCRKTDKKNFIIDFEKKCNAWERNSVTPLRSSIKRY